MQRPVLTVTDGHLEVKQVFNHFCENRWFNARSFPWGHTRRRWFLQKAPKMAPMSPSIIVTGASAEDRGRPLAPGELLMWLLVWRLFLSSLGRHSLGIDSFPYLSACLQWVLPKVRFPPGGHLWTSIKPLSSFATLSPLSATYLLTYLLSEFVS